MLTPLNGTGAPAVNAKYLGQIYVDDTPGSKAVYISVAVGSAIPSGDWEPADANAVLNTLKPFYGNVAPAVNAVYLGQVYVDTVGKAVYVSVAVDSEVVADDWQKVTEAHAPITGVVAPTAHAAYLGQIYIDSVAKKVYIAVATDSVAPADDWEEMTPVVG